MANVLRQGTITEYVPFGSHLDARHSRDPSTLSIVELLDDRKQKYMSLDCIPVPKRPRKTFLMGVTTEGGQSTSVIGLVRYHDAYTDTSLEKDTGCCYSGRLPISSYAISTAPTALGPPTFSGDESHKAVLERDENIKIRLPQK